MDLHYSKEYLDFEKEVKAFCKKYDGVTFTDASKNPLASSSSKKKRYKSPGVSGKKFLSNKVILQEQFRKNMGDMAVSQIF